MSSSDPQPPPNPNPVPLSSGDIPSSFDSDPDFFDEGRTGKLLRKLRQEPLIPLGCLATCYALYMATKSIRSGDHHQTNRMFRARIYAQGFTLVAIVAGSIFYQDERLKRKSFEKAIEEKKNAEKKEKWLRELEARDEEDRAWRARVEAQELAAQAARDAQRKEGLGRDVDQRFGTKSVRDAVLHEGWAPGMWAKRIDMAWRRS